MVRRTTDGDVEFKCCGREAMQVYLVGDFNEWSCTATPMSRTVEGEWIAVLSLPDGVYEYKYLADDQWLLDEAAENVDEVPFGSNCILVLNQNPVPALPAG